MHISEFSIQNYKCFDNTDIIKLKPGINIIVGKNNSGKTALLEALNLNFKNVPHQSLKVLPNKDKKAKNNISRVELTLSIDRNEFNHFLDEIPEPLAIPFPCIKESFNFLKEALEKIEKGELAEYNRKEFYTEALQHLDAQDFYRSDTVEDPDSNSFILRADATFKKFNEFLSQHNEPINLTLSISDNSQLIEDGKGSKRFNFNIYEPQHNKEITFIKVSKDGNDILKINPLFIDVLHADGSVEFPYYSTFLGEYKESIAYKTFNLHRNRIYRFYAQRPQIGNCPFGDNVELKPDASNLAEVLSCLQTNRKKFDEFNNYANEIFPLIKWISVVNRKGKFEILVWNVEQSTEREDLAMPLEYCGTGICQVLAILYILVTSQNSRTIIIDEPQA